MEDVFALLGQVSCEAWGLAAVGVAAAAGATLYRAYDQIIEYWRLDSFERREQAQGLDRGDGDAPRFAKHFETFLFGAIGSVGAAIAADLAVGWEGALVVLAAVGGLSLLEWTRRRLEGDEMLEAQQRAHDPFADTTFASRFSDQVPREAVAGAVVAFAMAGFIATLLVLLD